MQLTIDESLIRSLPLPLAELYHSVQRPYRKPLEQFLTTCQLWEAGLKLLGAVVVAEYARLDHKDPAIQKRLTNLARPALGHWWEFIKTLLPVLAKANPARFQPISKLLLETTIRDMPQAAALDVALQQEHDAPRSVSPRSTVQLKNLFDRLIWLRNQEVGHGALGQRKGSFYAQMSQKLLPGVVEVLTRLDVLAGRHLLYIPEVRRMPSGQWSVDRYELTGETGRIMEPLLIKGANVAQLPCPGQIYLQDLPGSDGKPTPPEVTLHPLVIFDPEEQEVMFLNERRGRGRLEYLCYSSGRTVDYKEVEQQELLSRLLDMEVNDERLAEWAKKAERENEEDEEPDRGEQKAETAAEPQAASPASESRPTAPPPPMVSPSPALTVVPAAAITVVPPATPTVTNSTSAPGLPIATAAPVATAVPVGTAIPVGKPIPVAIAIPSEGRRIGEFQLLSVLGEGGMGVVYRARQLSLGREVALKCLHPGGNRDRFSREIKALGRVKHPNLVEIFTSGSDGEQWFYAMELLDGATLSSVCSQLQAHLPTTHELTLKTWDASVKSACEKSRQSEKSLSSSSRTSPGMESLTPVDGAVAKPAEAAPANAGKRPLAKLTGVDYIRRVVELVRQVAEALEALHKIKVIHRDVKPSNIMVTPDGSHAVLMDLGLAKVVDESQTDLTRSRQFVGTLRYASPEQVHFSHNIDGRTDIYSLGATLWELLTFRPMHDATETVSPFEVEKRILFEEPGSVCSYNRAATPELDAIICKCLEKDPNDRYATAQQLADDLQKFLNGEPLPVRKRTLAQRGRGALRWVRRNRNLVSAGALLLVAAFAGMLTYRIWSQHYRVRVEHFGHFTKRFGAPVGLDRLDDSQVARRNFSYKLFARAGRVEKIEVVNGGGKLTTRHDTAAMLDSSSDTVARECRYDFKYDGDGNVTAESALDRAGEIVWTFNYTSANNKFKTTGYYTDREGNVRPRAASGATGLTSVWNENGYLKEVRYFDPLNRPQPDKDGSYGIQFERDDAGRVTKSTELDADGKPALNRLGICKVAHAYDARGNITESAYFDATDQPTRHKYGYARVKLEYDDNGNQIAKSFWRVDDQPGWHIDGYHRLVRKYDAAGLEIENLHFGEKNKPVVRKGGYHRVVWVNNEYDDAVEASFFGLDNKIAYYKDGYARWTAKYDAHGYRTELNYLDENGKPTHHIDGNAGWRAEYDSRGNQTKLTYVGADGKPMFVWWGYAYRENAYDEHGNQIATSYFDEHGKPCAMREQAYVKVVRKFDDRNHAIEESYWDEHGKLVRHKDGYVKFTKTYDDHGEWLTIAYFDENNRPVRSRYTNASKVVNKRDRLGRLIESGYSVENEASAGIIERYFYDDWGNTLELSWWDPDGKPSNTGIGRRHNRYDEHNNLIEETNRNLQGNLVMRRGNFARMIAKYDRRGNVLEKSYRDTDNKPVRIDDGYFRIAYTYNDHDSVVRIDYLNAEGDAVQLYGNDMSAIAYTFDRWNNKLTTTFLDLLNRPVRDRSWRYAGWKATCDAVGNYLEKVFLNEQGEVMVISDQFAKWRVKVDRYSQMTEVRYLDAKDQLVTNRSVSYAMAKWVYEQNRCVDASFFDEKEQPLDGRVVVTSVDLQGQGARLGIKVGDVLFSYHGVRLYFCGKFRTLRASVSSEQGIKNLVVWRDGAFLPPLELNANLSEGFEIEDRAGPPIRRSVRPDSER